MKDKQKRKKERTWAEAARLVRLAAEGGSVGVVRGGLAEHPPQGGGGARPCPLQEGAGHLPPGTGQPPKALGGERSPAGSDVAPFSARPPTPPNSCGGASWRAGSSSTGRRGPSLPSPTLWQSLGGLGKLRLCTRGS